MATDSVHAPFRPFLGPPGGWAAENLARVSRLLSRITYKEGYELKAQLTPYGDVSVWISAWLPDATGAVPGQRAVQIQTGMALAWQFLESLEDAALVHRIFTLIMEFERHEAGEWFKLDGVPPYDPHREDQIG